MNFKAPAKRFWAIFLKKNLNLRAVSATVLRPQYVSVVAAAVRDAKQFLSLPRDRFGRSAKNGSRERRFRARIERAQSSNWPSEVFPSSRNESPYFTPAHGGAHDNTLIVCAAWRRFFTSFSRRRLRGNATIITLPPPETNVRAVNDLFFFFSLVENGLPL